MLWSLVTKEETEALRVDTFSNERKKKQKRNQDGRRNISVHYPRAAANLK